MILALALGRVRAGIFVKTWAQRDIPRGPFSGKGSFGPLGVEGVT